MVRLLCLTSWYPPHHFGGYELSCGDVMTRLAERGHHVEVLTSAHRHDEVADGDPAPVAAVHRDLQLYFRDGDLWAPGAAGRVTVERHNQRALRAALDAARPDVVAVWHVGAMSLGLLTTIAERGLPMVHAVSDDWPAYAHRLDAWTRASWRLPRRARPWLRRLTGLPAAPVDLGATGPFCFISELTRDRVRRGSPWELPRTSIVYSGFDARRFPVAPPDAEVAPRPWRGRLLYVGRIDARKGTRTLVRALAHLPDATLTVDGRGSDADRADLRAWSDEAGVADRVTVTASTRDALPDVYADADVCVFPSEWEEPFGLVPLEAMACDTPVVATGVGGSAEFLADGGNCLRFPAGDEVALADAVQRLAGDAALRERLVRGGRRTATVLDVDHLADTFEAWYLAAAGGYPDGDPPRREPPLVAAGQPEVDPTRG
ncbi:glycosyltransferase family 4 protein [Nitriliruptoraceae bacterium ZYF776]|nr:glycosyltransferase family 4 protein [Profundirhabdus halotolerans]